MFQVVEIRYGKSEPFGTYPTLEEAVESVVAEAKANSFVPEFMTESELREQLKSGSYTDGEVEIKIIRN